MEKIAPVRAAARGLDRTLSFGIRLHVITRDTSAEAWAQARRLLARLDPGVIERVQRGLRRSETTRPLVTVTRTGPLRTRLSDCHSDWSAADVAE